MLGRRLHDAARSEDLCQETLRIALQNLRAGALREPDRLAAYLRGIAANLARRERRSLWRRVPLDRASEIPDHSPGPRDELLASERRHLVHAVLASLSAREREVLSEFYLGGLDKASVCQRHGFTPAQFDVVKFRALRRFGRLWAARVSVTEE
jgi:RNA polymerase sigma-70 factor (ECF subfamily)